MWHDPLTTIQALLAALLVGFAKTCVPGLAVLHAPLMASIFPAKESTGALLPMLLFADVLAVGYYRRHADWGIILRLLPWVVLGIVAGAATLGRMTNEGVNVALGVMVLAMVGLQFARQAGTEWIDENVTSRPWLAPMIGITAGFTTMLGNLAGPVMGIYLIARGLKKDNFIGTTAWFFLIVNAIKIPFSVGLGLITSKSLTFGLEVAPFIVAGALAGFVAFRYISQKWFNRAILALAVVAAAKLIFSAFAGK